MNYFILPNGNLMFTITPSEALELDQNALHPFDLLEMSGADLNGFFDCTDKIGLTSAPAICDDFDENCNPSEDANVWYYKDYTTCLEKKVLYNQGYVIYTAHPENDKSLNFQYPYSLLDAIFFSKAMNWENLNIVNGRVKYANGHYSNHVISKVISDGFVNLETSFKGLVESLKSYNQIGFWGVKVLRYCEYLEKFEIDVILNSYDNQQPKGEVRTTNGNENIFDLILLDTPDII